VEENSKVFFQKNVVFAENQKIIDFGVKNMKTIEILLLIVLIIFFALYIGSSFYCGKNSERWLEESRNYCSKEEGFAFWGCIILGIGDIVFLINFISDSNMIGILITLGLEIFFIVYGIYLFKKISKRNPPQGIFKLLILMLGVMHGESFNRTWGKYFNK